MQKKNGFGIGAEIPRGGRREGKGISGDRFHAFQISGAVNLPWIEDRPCRAQSHPLLLQSPTTSSGTLIVLYFIISLFFFAGSVSMSA